MSALRPMKATVYQGARRRFFSKAAAERSYFWAALKRRCECEEPTRANDYNGYACEYHRGDNRDQINRLLKRFLRIHFRPLPLPETGISIGAKP